MRGGEKKILIKNCITFVIAIADRFIFHWSRFVGEGATTGVVSSLMHARALRDFHFASLPIPSIRSVPWRIRGDVPEKYGPLCVYRPPEINRGGARPDNFPFVGGLGRSGGRARGYIAARTCTCNTYSRNDVTRQISAVENVWRP